MPEMKELINRLIEWLKAHGLSDSDIIECIKHITN